MCVVVCLPFNAFLYFYQGDYLPDCRVRTEEDSYCEDDCHVLNEGKLVGCPTVVPRLMKYCLGGTTYVHAISNFFMQYTMRSCPQRRIGLLRTLCNWVGPKRRLLYEPAWRGQSHWSTRL